MAEFQPDTEVERTGEKDAPQKLRLIPQIYGWLIVLIGIGLILILVPTAIGSLYFDGLSVETLFGSGMLLIEGFGVGGGFIAFGTALRRIVVVQATLCAIILLIMLWFVVFFAMYDEWAYAVYSLAAGLLVTAPLSLAVILNRKAI